MTQRDTQRHGASFIGRSARGRGNGGPRRLAGRWRLGRSKRCHSGRSRAPGRCCPSSAWARARWSRRSRRTAANRLVGVLRALVAHGGKLVDTWPRNADNDAAFGRVIGMPEFRTELVRCEQGRRGGQGSGHCAVRRDAEAVRPRDARSRAGFQPDRRRHALAEPQGMEGGRLGALYRRHGFAGVAARGSRALLESREARFRPDELLDHGAAGRAAAAAVRCGARRGDRDQSPVHERRIFRQARGHSRCPSGRRSSIAGPGRSSR